MTESVVIQNGFSDGVAVREHPIKAERPADEIKNLGKNLSIELRKIARQELTQWQMLRLVVDCIENLPVKLQQLLFAMNFEKQAKSCVNH